MPSAARSLATGVAWRRAGVRSHGGALCSISGQRDDDQAVVLPPHRNHIAPALPSVTAPNAEACPGRSPGKAATTIPRPFRNFLLAFPRYTVKIMDHEAHRNPHQWW